MTSRQEVAKKLRESGKWLDSGDTASIREALFLIDQNVEAPNCREFAPLFDRLADLIDPTCEGVEEREDDGIDAPPRYTSHCGNCGQMWDETSGIPRFPMYCPNCGDRVVRGRLNPWVVKD